MPQLFIEREEEGGERTITILEFLKERMDGSDRLERRKTLKERLGWKGMGCCGGPNWGSRGPSTISVGGNDDDMGPPLPAPEIEVIDVSRSRTPTPDRAEPGCVVVVVAAQTPVVSGMNLATALAAERNYREGQDDMSPSPSPARRSHTGPGGEVTTTADTTPRTTPLRMSLMKLLEESDGVDEMMGKEGGGVGVGCDQMCCVCMGRKKGAAFIPCGHTFCRVCSRELWLNRGSCPLCNRSILEILDIF